MIVLLLHSVNLQAVPHLSNNLTVIKCGTRLVELTGRSKEEAQLMVNKYLQATDIQGTEFLKYMFAVMYVESAFNRNAISSASAVGLMQMTQVALTDTINSCGYPTVSLEELYDPTLNVKYGSCFLNSMLKKSEGNWTKTLILYNGGFRQLTSYEKGESIASETANYVLKVNRALNLCRHI